jgi:glycosidase
MSKKISIYHVLPRLFGNKNLNCIPNGTILQNGCGKFNDFTAVALEEIRKLGITHVWYTGVIEHGTMTDYSAYGIPKDHPSLLKGRAGSPYAIKDYYDVDPDLAENVENRMDEFQSLIKRTHEAGMKVIMDFVPNHLFRQYNSDSQPEGIKSFGEDDDNSKAFDPQNNFYYLPGTSFEPPEGLEWTESIQKEFPDEPYEETPAKATGNDRFAVQPDIYDWFETIKLNYGVDILGGRINHFSPIPDTWHKMLHILNFWAEKGVDAFRCDMAEMVPVEFWEWAIRKIKEKYPEMLFIAEVYNPFDYQSFVKWGGFDYLYDKVGLYDTLKNIIRYQNSTSSITNCWQVLDGMDAHMLRFLENHDEVRFSSREFAENSDAAIPAMMVSACMNTGPVMIYNGQEVGEPAEGAAGFSGDDGRTTIYDYFNIPEHQKWMNDGKFDGENLLEEQKQLRNFYRQLLNFSIQNEAVSQGQFFDLMYANPYETLPTRDKVYSWLRHTENQKLLFITQFDKALSGSIRIRIPEHAFEVMGLADKSLFSIKGLFRNEEEVQISKSELIETGFQVELNKWDGKVFEIK